MAYRNFNPGERDRNWRERWRPERDDDAMYQGRYRYGGGEGDESERRGWRQGSDYYGDNPERYGERRYGGSFRDDRSADVWRSGRDQWSDDRSRGRGIADAFGDFTRPEDANTVRWSDVEEQARYPSDWRQSRGDWPEDRGDERTARDTQRWRSDMLRYGGWGSLASAAGMGEHRGRGPRGYRRSDDRIREDVCDFLTDDPGVDATDIEVLVQNGEVTLSGEVSTRAEKRRAEDLVESLSGVSDVHNRLRTREPGLLERAAEALRPHGSETRTGPGTRR
jgi:hypothetical protein